MNLDNQRLKNKKERQIKLVRRYVNIKKKSFLVDFDFFILKIK